MVVGRTFTYVCLIAEMSESVRSFAGLELPPDFTLRTVHAWGWPEEIAPRQPNLKVLMPLPRVLVLRTVTHGFLLERFAEDGTFAGDTWHESESAALRDAEVEYGPYVGAWQTIPEHVRDLHSYALDELRRSAKR